MADSTLDSELFILFDHWPGRVISYTAPVGGMTGATHHNVTTAAYKVGSKIMLLNPSTTGDEGWSTFIYLKGLSVTEANPTCAAKQIVIPSLSGTWSQVTNDPDRCLAAEGATLAAVMLSVMTFTHSVTKYGWFWCGGVCPESAVTDLGGNFATEGNVAIGPICTNDLTADAIGLGPVAADTEAVIGFSYSLDAA